MSKLDDARDAHGLTLGLTAKLIRERDQLKRQLAAALAVVAITDEWRSELEGDEATEEYDQARAKLAEEMAK